MKNGRNNNRTSKNSIYDALPQKKVIKFIIDTATLFFAYALASLLRFDFRPTPGQIMNVQNSLLLAIIIPTVIIYTLRVNHGKWRYSSLADLMNLFGAFTIGWAAFVFILYFMDALFVPRTILLMYWVLGMFSLSVTRAMPRILAKLRMYMLPDKRRTMVIGAGDAGEMIIRQMKNNPELGYYPVAIVDDSKKKINTKIHGVKVFGGISKLTEIARIKKIDEIIIATPSARPTQMRRIVQLCEATGIEFKTVPGPREIVNGQVELNQIRKVKIDDLLDRQPVQIDWEKISAYTKNKVVLITGAGGSIGSELSRQILKLNPKKLICLDRTENSLFYLEHELRQMHEQTDYQVCVADILDEDKISSVLTKHQPDMVFHAAAYKHVPLMELHPEEAIRNNVIGTHRMMSLSEKYGVEKFVLISTDKAVNPSSIMGATKRTAELILQSYSSKTDMKLI
ncbi:MAG: SDR family NAD(P)-dependent oxidoreductase, partial [Calditrichaceae bacterium]